MRAPETSGPIKFFENLFFSNRRTVIIIFAIMTLVMLWFARGLHVDAGFTKQLPTKHEYMQTYLDHQVEFGGANRVLVALVARDGNMFTAEFFEALKQATDEVFFIPGVERARVSSLFTPNTRYIEVIEGGIAAGNVVPADFQPTEAGLNRVRENILKSNIVGRLVANDFSGAIISAQLLEVDPNSGEKLDLVRVSHDLEEKIRDRFGDEFPSVDVHMIGFAKVIGDVTDGARMVVLFFLVAFLITVFLVYYYTQSFRLSVIPLVCSIIAVIWQLGLLTAMGFGIDPMGILVPFLVFAISVSHGVQMVSVCRSEVFDGLSSMSAARRSFERLVVPGSIALISDTIGFITIYFIEIRMIQEMAITASVGVAVIILTNLILLPVLMSYVKLDEDFKARLQARAQQLRPLWAKLAVVSQRGPAAVIILISAGLMVFGLWTGLQVKVGDLHQGVPELRADSRYNQDTRVITERFSIGVDIITVIVETIPEGCIDYEVMSSIDDFSWYMANVPGVQSVITLPTVAKIVNAGWNEGTLKWRVLSRNTDNLVQSISSVDTSSGLLNSDCSVMPVMMFSEDHKAETIARIVNAVKEYRTQYGSEDLKFRLATGNVGVMAATNEEVEAAQFPILLGVFSAVIILCIATFATTRAAGFFLIPAAIAALAAWFLPDLRMIISLVMAGYTVFWLKRFPTSRAVLCVVLPLALVSVLAYALMVILEIGLKVSTLPVVALGVGVGVDYGIYIYSRFKAFMSEGLSPPDAYHQTLLVTGNGVVFTGVTLGIGVVTWIFSPLKFQADMGLLLTFMFILNMLGAILLLPALAAWLLPRKITDRYVEIRGPDADELT